MVSDAEWMTLEECRRKAIQTERDSIADWMDSCATDIAIKLRDVKHSGTRVMLNKERGDLMLLSKLIRSGTYIP